jgi:putative ABC transport system substrate-binding protein
LGEKKLELLREVVPGVKVIGVLESPNVAASTSERARVLTAAQAIGQQVFVLRATQERDFESVFASLVRAHAGALLVTGDALFTSRRDRLLALAARHAIPTVHSERQTVQAGALISYGTDIPDAYRLAGIYTGRILKGEKPADLPVIQATKFELAINLKTAKALGITIPPSVVMRADEVIQ